MNNLFDLARVRAERSPERGYRFLADGVTTSAAVTYAQLDEHCRKLAAAIQLRQVPQGARALLLYSPGLEFVKAFWACFYAGIVAVPAPVPDFATIARLAPRLRAIASSCKPDAILTDGSAASDAQLRQFVPELGAVPTINTTLIESFAGPWTPPKLARESVAVIQYSSGSTGTPRGVAVSHGNFLHNLDMLQMFYGGAENAVIFHWLPLYHDMGLIRGMMSPLHLGGDCIMIPPMTFVRKPLLWLAGVSRYRATIIGAPNFGYELCNRKILEEDLAFLDLSTLQRAFCSAEPIRASTVDRFIRKFSTCGFRRGAFRTSYGLAEATVMVCGAMGDSGPRIRYCDRGALLNNQCLEAAADDPNPIALVSCGVPLGGQEVIVVDTAGGRAEPNKVGEIWLRGASVAQGYWANTDMTDEVFRAHTRDGDGPFLRTGDLGCMDHNGELFVVGRATDLIIVRGQNYHPQDIESIVENSTPQLRPGCTVAFSVDSSEGELVVLVCEPATDVEKIDWKFTTAAVRGAVSEVLGVALSAVAFIKRGTLPKTASGKVQRGQTKASFLANELAILYAWHTSSWREWIESPATRDYAGED